MAIKNQNANLKNVAIIMDGNGRWARKNSLKISQGHKKGVQIEQSMLLALRTGKDQNQKLMQLKN